MLCLQSIRPQKGKSKYSDRAVDIKFTVFVFIDAPNVIPRGRGSGNEGWAKQELLQGD